MTVHYVKARTAPVDYVKVGRVTAAADAVREHPTPDADGVIRLRKGESITLSAAGRWS